MRHINILLFLYVLWALEDTAHGYCGRQNCLHQDKFKCECETGCYGSDCRHSCSTGCKSNKCNSSTGHCFQCIHGYYGNRCERECPSGCHDKKCDRDTGICNGHCTAGFYGRMCNKKCPEHCNTARCNQQTGECHRGCVSSYQGDFCNETAIVTQDKLYSAASKPSFIVNLIFLHSIWSVFLS